MKTIQIDITAEGKIQIEGKNFTGKDCDAKMKAFEEGLGSVKDRFNKPEYNQTVSTGQKVGG